MVGGPFPIFPASVSLPSSPDTPLASPVVLFSGAGRVWGAPTSPETPVGTPLRGGQKPGQGSCYGTPLMGVPSPCPGRPCRIRQRRRSQLSRGAGPFLQQEPPEELFPRPGGSGSPPPSPVPPSRGEETSGAPATPLLRPGGRAPSAGVEPGPVSRRGRKPGRVGTSPTRARAGPAAARPNASACAPAPAGGETWGLGGSAGSGPRGWVALGTWGRWARMGAVTPGLCQAGLGGL